MKKKKNLVLFLLMLAIIIVTTFVRYKNALVDVPVFFSLCTITAFILVKTGYASSKQVASTMVVSILLLYSIAFVIDSVVYYIDSGISEWEIISVGTPNFVMAMAGIVCGAWLADSFNKKQMVAVSILATTICLVFSIWYYRSLHLYWFNYINNDSFTGRVSERVKDNGWYIISQSNDTLTQQHCKDKIVLFDFWNTACGGCFKKFPDIERIYQQYKDHSDFVLNTINIPIKRDTAGMAFAMMEKYGNTYSFPVFVADSTMHSTFDIKAFPTVIIMKNNEIVFRGRVELVEDYLAKLLGKEG